jgi:hypothetical protein
MFLSLSTLIHNFLLLTTFSYVLQTVCGGSLTYFTLLDKIWVELSEIYLIICKSMLKIV